MQEFSVLLTLYAGEEAEYLKESLESVIQQTLPPKEIVVIKGGPLTEGLEQVLEEFGTQFTGEFIVVPLEKDIGLGAALEIGIKVCRSPLIFRLDTNTVLHPERFALQMEAMENNQELVLVGGQISELPGSPEAHFARRGAPFTDDEIRENKLKRNPFFHETICYRRGAVLDAGNYRIMEWFEDYWLWLRMLEQGKAANLSEVLVYIRDSEEKFLRRGGISYAKSVREFQGLLKNKKLISKPKYLFRTVKGTLGAMLPGKLRVFFNNGTIKKENKKIELAEETLKAATEHLTKEEEELAMADNKVVQCDEFLKKYGMHYESIAMKKEVAYFVEEMGKGLAGKESSLLMLPTYLSVSGTVPYNEPIVVIDAGGTNFRVAVVTFREDEEPLLEDFKMYHMPGTKGAITKEEFFDTIAERLLPVIERSKKVGFCFSYPTTILPNRDGQFIAFSKEVSVSDMEGVVIGEEINKSLAKHKIEPREFLLLNDTVAAMLGGVDTKVADQIDGYIGFILGTGTNICYSENTENIIKSPEAQSRGGEMAINVESGGYSKFPRGVIDEEYDNSTNKPEYYKFEKMVSGAYQGGVLFLTVMRAIQENLLSSKFAGELSLDCDVIPLWEVDQFLAEPNGDNALAKSCENEQDRAVLKHIFEVSYERAARLVSIALGATIVKMGKGNNPEKPVRIVAEGTTFQKSKVFREKLDYYVESFLNKELGVYCNFYKTEDATLLGTAVAGLIG